MEKNTVLLTATIWLASIFRSVCKRRFFSGMYAGLATGMDAGARMLSEYISSYSLTLGYHAADVYAAFTASETNLCNAVMSPLNLDFHPNADGHKTIAGCVQSVLDSLK